MSDISHQFSKIISKSLLTKSPLLINQLQIIFHYNDKSASSVIKPLLKSKCDPDVSILLEVLKTNY